MATSMEAIPENAGKGFEVGEEVKVERGSGAIEEGWKVVIPVSPDTDPETRVMLIGPNGETKSPTLAKLREWNS